MTKYCVLDGDKIGVMTGYIEIADKDYVCSPHWKAMGFNTTNDLFKLSKIITADEVKEIISKGVNGRDFMNAKSGENARAKRIRDEFDKAGVSDLFGTKKEVKALSSIINDDESVKYATSGLVDGNTVLMVCTNQRIIFIDKGLFYGIKSVEIPLSMVNAISYSKGVVLGKISITNGAQVTKVDSVDKQTAPIMVNAINTARKELAQSTIRQTITVSSSPSTVDQLRDLKSLVDDGIITQDDFNEKKKQLLGL